MNQPTRKTLSIASLVVDLNLNIRQADNYDIPQMKEQILSAGRILKPIIIRGEDNKVLSGNRRTLAGQELLKAEDTPADVKEALKKVDVIVYTGLSQQDELTLIIDHGSEKPISRTEMVNAVWRMSKQMFSEAQIIKQLYFALAKYTGNERKLAEVPKDPAARDAFLKKWLHGTVGNYMLAALGMGEYIRAQFILTHRAEDKMLGKDEAVELRCSRDRINQLSQAKSADTREGGWNPEEGGVKFNEMVQKFKNEDAGLGTTEKKTRPTVKELTEKADAFKTGLVRKALLLAAGENEKAEGIVDDDDRAYRDLKCFEILVKNVDGLPKALKDFAGVLLSKPLPEVEKHLKELVEKEKERVAAEEARKTAPLPVAVPVKS